MHVAGAAQQMLSVPLMGDRLSTWSRPLRLFSLSVVLAGTAFACSAPVATAPTDAEEEEEDDDDRRKGGDRDDDDPASDEPSGKRLGSALVVDLGQGSAGKTLTLDVPKDALGFHLVATSSAGGELGIERLKSPSGVVVFDGFKPKNGSFEIGESIEGTASVQVPANDLPQTMPLEKGTWSVTLGGSGSGSVEARIQTSDGGAFRGGVLDLHVWVPAGLQMSDPSAVHTVDPTRAASDPDISQRVSTFYSLLQSTFGIARGKVSFHAAPGGFRLLSTDALTAQAARIPSKSEDAQALHLVLANDLLNGELLGLSPGIPGAVTRMGTSMSAIMAAHYEDEQPSDATTDALTWLHEMGHFVGLQHTTESDGTMFDALGDTPKCPNRTEQTACPDQGNLMFTGEIPSPPIVTIGQRTVVRSSPLYRATGSAGAFARPMTTPIAVTPPRWTRSGRALRPLEGTLLGALCGSSRFDPTKLGPRDRVIADLRTVAGDHDLVGILRTKATRTLERLGAR
jgi:hypothetical protein